MTPRRRLILGMALGAALPFAGFGLAGGAMLALTQPPFAGALGVDRWLVHPWLSLAGAAAALWPLAVCVAAAFILGLRALGLSSLASASLAGPLAWAGLAATMATLDAGGVAGPAFQELLETWAKVWAPPALLAAAALHLGPRFLAQGRLGPGAEDDYLAAGDAGRMP